MTSLAQAHATVLERLGVFVQESSAAIANLTSRVEGAERAVVDAVERVELMENQVGGGERGSDGGGFRGCARRRTRTRRGSPRSAPRWRGRRRS